MLTAQPVRARRRRAATRAGLAVLAVVAVLSASVLTACEDTSGDRAAAPGSSASAAGATPTPSDGPVTADPDPQGDDGDPADPADPAAYAVDPPGAFDGRVLSADALVTAEDTLPPSVVRRVARLDGVLGVERLSIASASVEGRTLSVAAVDPSTYRRFTPLETARAGFVWERLAGGEVAVDASVDRRLIGKGDMLRLSSREDPPVVHVGAYAPLTTRRLSVDATRPVAHVLVNKRRADQLGMPEGNALMISTGSTTPSQLRKAFRRVLPGDAELQILALELRTQSQRAVLTGGSVAQAVGTFSYTNGPDGTIVPDPAWVREYIRTEEVPILGRVTCNKAYLPQLRAALQEVVDRGLAHEIHPDEYAGCYYPRYIGREASNGLSLHSWGIAVDLNVPGNLRGTVGEIDRTVVAIFKKWGMGWGGDWSYTDPMHFEMNAVVRPG